MTQWLRELRTHGTSAPLTAGGDFEPLAREVKQLATSLSAARAAAQEEARLRDTAEATWTTERLRIFVEGRLGGTRLFAVSNREPYEHRHQSGGIESVMPASGLVTALEPILRACDGTWIAQGTGDADRDTVDAHDHVRVPPDHPQYTLRRVWLTPEEERGFYYGFANEGYLAALPHRAHAPGVSRRRLAALSRRQPEVRRRRCWRKSRQRRTRSCWCRTITSRCCRAMIKEAAARRAGGDFLAHSLAESGGLRDLPVAARTAGRTAGRRPDRISHSGALQQLSGDGGPRAGIADRVGALCGQSRTAT